MEGPREVMAKERGARKGTKEVAGGGGRCGEHMVPDGAAYTGP